MISIRNNLRVSSSSSHNLIVKLNATKYAIKIDDRLFTHHALCRLPPLCAHSANCPAHTLCCVCVLQQTHSGQRVRNVSYFENKTKKRSNELFGWSSNWCALGAVWRCVCVGPPKSNVVVICVGHTMWCCSLLHVYLYMLFVLYVYCKSPSIRDGPE